MKTLFRMRAVAVLGILACMTVGSVIPRIRRAPSRNITLRGDIDWAQGGVSVDDTMPHFHVYFGGRHTVSDDNGMYRLTVSEEEKEQMLTNLSLIICKRFVPEFERAQTVAGMKIQKEHKCKWYNLVREYDEKTQQNYWSWKLRTGDNAPQAGELLPDNAIVISMSGARVVRLVEDRLPKQITGETVLPRILIQPGEKSVRGAIKSDIESITSRKMNANQRPEVREKEGVTLAAPTQ